MTSLKHACDFLHLGVALLVGLAGTICCPPAAAEDHHIDFNRDVRAILSDKCFLCHGPAEDSREAGLRLDVRDEAIDFGAIVPGEPDESQIIERIEADDEDLLMPPPSSNKSLTAKEKQVLRDWIASGAMYADHWAFSPLPGLSTPPASEEKWARSEVDRFVFTQLQKAGLKPNREANRETWLRRVTFDLTGLPPTLGEIDAFLADKSEQAYEKVVDRLLSSDAHAERLASEWLDVARYSDSYGYQRDDRRFVWPYRDWVTESFKKNRPYDQFVTWQLAGDLLPNATREQQLATVFCRLHSHKKEGGVAVEEFRVENVADRTHTFASAFLGLTMECARCHDHKYDPITMRDYYQLSSFFANVDERGLISYFTNATPTPAMPLPNAEQEKALEEAETALQAAEKQHQDTLETARASFETWLASADRRPAEVKGPVVDVNFDNQLEEAPKELLFEEDKGFVKVEKKKLSWDSVVAFENAADDATPAINAKANKVVDGMRGRGVSLTGDDAIIFPKAGHFERYEPFTLSLWIKPSEVKERAVIIRRSRGWDDAGSVGYALIKIGDRLRANLAHFWPGNAIGIETDAVLQADKWSHVTVTYDGSRKAAGLHIYVDGAKAESIVLYDSLTRTISNWSSGYTDLAIGSRYRDRGFKGGVVDECRVFDRGLTPLEVRQNFDGKSLDMTIGKKASELTPDERSVLFDYFVANVDEATKESVWSLRQARERLDKAMDATPSITVMREQATPRPAYILERGRYDAHGEQVTAGTPAALPEFSEDLPRNRLGLAMWLFHPDHPLTARVAVNRYWQLLFGAGLVSTPEDFGRQSAAPTHPELLDWLARDFVDNGWDVRRMLRMLVLSSTYRQDSAVDPAVREADPENKLLSRAPSKPLPAEMIRDNVLAVSGLLETKVGGPPVKPYDLALAYNPIKADQGAGLYRRSLYTFWKRTSPSPVMMTMNANRREVCLLKRDSVSSPLQALVLLNGTQFVEASRVYASQLLAKHGDNLDAIVNEAFRSLTSRVPTEKEAAILLTGLKEQHAAFEADPKAAEELIKVGAAPSSGEFSPVDLAATTILVNSIMNLDEGTRCR